MLIPRIQFRLSNLTRKSSNLWSRKSILMLTLLILEFPFLVKTELVWVRINLSQSWSNMIKAGAPASSLTLVYLQCAFTFWTFWEKKDHKLVAIKHRWGVEIWRICTREVAEIPFDDLQTTSSIQPKNKKPENKVPGLFIHMIMNK